MKDVRPEEVVRGEMKAQFIFDRGEERESIRKRLSDRRAFLLHGPAGVGKTFLLQSVLSECPLVLYCRDADTSHAMFRNLARGLLRAGNRRMLMAFRDERAVDSRSAVSLKGIVMDALKQNEYSIVLDHLKWPSQSFAAAVREITGLGSTPVTAVARSSHMEDAGFLQPFYADRSERYELRNFETPLAERFARQLIERLALSASNLDEFIARAVEFTAGNPGAIVSLVEMARLPKYRSDEHIKVTPLYIDFRLTRPGAVPQ